MDGDRVTTIAGFAGALVVLGGLVAVVGVGDVLSALSQARTPVLLVMVGVAAIWLSSWGLVLATILESLDAPIAPAKAILVFSAAVFSNNITPFGQAGGEPFSALLISQAADSEYETGLAAIASVDTLHFIPSIALAIAGFSLGMTGSSRFSSSLTNTAILLVVLTVTLPVAAVLGWRYRYELESVVVRTVTPVIHAIWRFVPRLTEPTAESIERRIEGFFAAIERVASDRRALVLSMAFSALGWLALSTALWLALFALGYTVPYAATILVVPMGAMASITPLPGGSGAIETVLVTLLVPTAGIPWNVAVSAVLLYRGATYWLPLIVGGGVATHLGTTHARTR